MYSIYIFSDILLSSLFQITWRVPLFGTLEMIQIKYRRQITNTMFEDTFTKKRNEINGFIKLWKHVFAYL